MLHGREGEGVPEERATGTINNYVGPKKKHLMLPKPGDVLLCLTSKLHANNYRVHSWLQF